MNVRFAKINKIFYKYNTTKQENTILREAIRKIQSIYSSFYFLSQNFGWFLKRSTVFKLKLMTFDIESLCCTHNVKQNYIDHKQ